MPKKRESMSEWQTSWFRFKLADGRVVVAPAHGAGGLFRGTHGAKQIRRAIRAAAAGEPTGYYEPKPGYMLVWPQYSFADNGPELLIPLAGATVRLAKATRERTRAHKAGKAALGPDDWAAKPHHATRKKSPAQLDREIAEALTNGGSSRDLKGRRAHSTISEAHMAERRKRDPGAWSSRAQLVDIARQAAASVFAPRKIAPSEGVIQKAKSAAFKAIQRHDPLAGTSDHPAAAYAHGIMDIAMEATEEARQRWEMLHESLRKLRRR